MHKRLTLDTAVNLLLGLTCVVILSKYAHDWWRTEHNPPSTAAVKLRAGTRIGGLSGAAWNARNLVIFVRSGCQFCTDSMPFYRLLSHEARDAGVRLIAVGPEPREVLESYLHSHAIAPDEVISASSEATHVTATPTIAIVDRTATVLEAWVGKLPGDAELNVRAALAAR
jgi:hypothetical protein